MRWTKYRGVYLSLLLTAVAMPMVVAGIISSQQMRLFSFASQPEPLRIWIEPAAVIAKPGQTFKLTVMGEYDQPGGIIPMVRAGFNGDGLILAPTAIEYAQAFSGKTILGTINVRASKTGIYRIEAVDSSVYTSLPDLSVVTGQAQISIQ